MPFPMVKSPVGYFIREFKQKLRYAYVRKTNALITNKTHVRFKATYRLGSIYGGDGGDYEKIRSCQCNEYEEQEGHALALFCDVLLFSFHSGIL